MIKLREYLKSVVATYKTAKSIHLQVCIGNVSADMDSIIGSLLLSYFLTQSGKLTIPHINCKKEQLSMRLETYKLLIDNDLAFNLIFHDAVEYKAFQQNNKVGVILYDHNFPDTNQQYLIKNVGMIVDHHAGYMNLKCQEKHIILCGSCTSLVVNMFQALKDWDKDLALLAISPILIDCNNFKKRLKDLKWNDNDSKACNFLLKFLPGFDNDKYYHLLNKKKHDVKSNLALGVDNLLIKDYKNYSITEKFKYGSSVISMKPKTLLKQFGTVGVHNSMKNIIITKSLNFYILNSLCVDSHRRKRELICMSNSESQLDKFSELLLENTDACLSVIMPPFMNCRMFKMKNKAITRKILEPRLHEIFKQVTLVI